MTKKKKYIYINLKNTREDKDLKQKDMNREINRTLKERQR